MRVSVGAWDKASPPGDEAATSRADPRAQTSLDSVSQSMTAWGRSRAPAMGVPLLAAWLARFPPLVPPLAIRPDRPRTGSQAMATIPGCFRGMLAGGPGASLQLLVDSPADDS